MPRRSKLNNLTDSRSTEYKKVRIKLALPQEAIDAIAHSAQQNRRSIEDEIAVSLQQAYATQVAALARAAAEASRASAAPGMPTNAATLPGPAVVIDPMRWDYFLNEGLIVETSGAATGYRFVYQNGNKFRYRSHRAGAPIWIGPYDTPEQAAYARALEFELKQDKHKAAMQTADQLFDLLPPDPLGRGENWKPGHDS